MRKMFKRLLSMTIALVMVLSMIPTGPVHVHAVTADDTAGTYTYTFAYDIASGNEYPTLNSEKFIGGDFMAYARSGSVAKAGASYLQFRNGTVAGAWYALQFNVAEAGYYDIDVGLITQATSTAQTLDIHFVPVSALTSASGDEYNNAAVADFETHGSASLIKSSATNADCQDVYFETAGDYLIVLETTMDLTGVVNFTGFTMTDVTEEVEKELEELEKEQAELLAFQPALVGGVYTYSVTVADDDKGTANYPANLTDYYGNFQGHARSSSSLYKLLASYVQIQSSRTAGNWYALKFVVPEAGEYDIDLEMSGNTARTLSVYIVPASALTSATGDEANDAAVASFSGSEVIANDDSTHAIGRYAFESAGEYLIVLELTDATTGIVNFYGMTLAEHKYEAVVTDPTCTEAGYTTYTCIDCGDSYTADEVSPAGHSWVEADCENVKICSICGTTEGDPLGHSWVDADCETAKTCSICDEIEGDPLGHSWVEADCENAKTCSVCGETEGDPLGHSWVDADCETAKTCSICGETEGDPLGHTWVEAGCETAKTCSICGETEGDPLGHTCTYGTCERCGADISLSGTCGENLTWVLDVNGTLTISGTGTMTDYANWDETPWLNNTSIKTVVIEDGVTSIGAHAFVDCISLTSITIPDSVTSIGRIAFDSCGLTSVTIPGSVTSIGECAFVSCNNLTTVNICNGVTSIGDGAFEYCTGLTSVTIPSSVTSIGDIVFDLCTGLTEIIFKGDAPAFGEGAFSEGVVATAYYPAGNATWTDEVMQNYGGTITWIMSACEHTWVEADCETAKTCSICGETEGDPLGHTIVDDICERCGTYGTCGENLIWTLDSAGTLTISGTGAMTDYSSANTPWYENCESIKTVVIEDGVTTIGSNAFFDQVYMTSVTIPDSVTSIGEGAFSYCDNLTSITIPAGVTSIENMAFQHCTNLTSVTIPDSVTNIGEFAFSECENLANLTIPDSVTAIGRSAFEGCFALVSVTIPDTVTSIGDYAFAVCTGLTEIIFEGDAPTFGEDVFWEVVATAYYPAGNATWTDEVMQSYGGTITWTMSGCEHIWVEADCETAKTCSICGEIEGDPLGHTWVEADCKTAKTCPVCGETEGDPLGHVYDAVVTAPTCTEGGYTTYTCFVCGDSIADEIAALGHVWNEGEITAAPDCDEAGVKIYTCNICGETKTEAVDALGHSYESVYTPANDTQNGYTTYTCSNCGHSYTVADVQDSDVSFDDVEHEGEDVTEEEKQEVIDRIDSSKEEVKVVHGFDKDRNKDAIRDMKEKYPHLKDEAPRMDVHAKQIKIKGGRGTRVVYDVTPMLGDYPIDIQDPITFRLPVDSHIKADHVAVFHEDELMGMYPVHGDENGKYIIVTSGKFSPYTVDAEYGVAKIGETYYLTLQDAVDNANGGTVTLLADVKTDAAIEVSNTVTLNLNGYSVSTTEKDTSGDGVFHVVSGGDLTINGEGTINGVGGNDYNMAIWADGGKVTINGGTYTNVGATDSTGDTHFDLIYVKNGGEIVINGGKFISENPAWTLNSHNALTGTIAVYGGEFVDFDPANNTVEGEGTNFLGDKTQHTKCVDGVYSICEGEHAAVVTDPDCVNGGYTTYTCPACGDSYVADETAALGHSYGEYEYNNDATVDADGTKTAACSVCGATDTVTAEGTKLPAPAAGAAYDESTGEYYDSVAAALTAAAGKNVTIVLAMDCAETYVMITPGLTLDLAGYTLEATYVVGFDTAHVIDSSADNTGVLKIAENGLVLDDTNAQLPVYAPDKGGYIFIETLGYNQWGEDVVGDNAYAFEILFETVVHQYLSDGAADNNMELAVRMTWVRDTGTSYQNHVYNDETIGGVISSYNESAGYYNNVFNVSWDADYVGFTLNVVLISGTGVEVVVI